MLAIQQLHNNANVEVSFNYNFLINKILNNIRRG